LQQSTQVEVEGWTALAPETGFLIFNTLINSAEDSIFGLTNPTKSRDVYFTGH
jgi:hypothetical protein